MSLVLSLGKRSKGNPVWIQKPMSLEWISLASERSRSTIVKSLKEGTKLCEVYEISRELVSQKCTKRNQDRKGGQRYHYWFKWVWKEQSPKFLELSSKGRICGWEFLRVLKYNNYTWCRFLGQSWHAMNGRQLHYATLTTWRFHPCEILLHVQRTWGLIFEFQTYFFVGKNIFLIQN